MQQGGGEIPVDVDGTYVVRGDGWDLALRPQVGPGKNYILFHVQSVKACLTMSREQWVELAQNILDWDIGLRMQEAFDGRA